MNNHNKTSRRWTRLLLLGSTLAFSAPLISCAKDSSSDDKKKEEKAKTEATAKTTPSVTADTATKTATADTKTVMLNVLGMN
ncbi:MAG: hypothetical protein JKY56_26960 [Kofleriaceae bacterium]|nr:hypothetical protein [Kofleriaceae bacterium]